MTDAGLEPGIASAHVRGRAPMEGVITRSVAACAVPIIVAEVLVAAGAPVAAASVDAAVLLVIVHRFLLAGELERRLVGALALLPLLRLLSLTMAVESPLASYALAGVPLLFAAIVAARTLGVALHIHVRDLRERTQWAPAVAALLLGAMAALVWQPQPLLASRSAGALAAGALVVFVFAGVLEELIFRGILQPSLGAVFGSPVLDANLLFVAMYLATGSVAAVAAAALGGGFCGWWAQRTGRLTGVAAAHGLLAAGYLVVWPVVLG